MSITTVCQTPGARFHAEISRTRVGCVVDLPFDPELTAEQARLLEANIHNALELVLAPLWMRRQGDA